MLVENSGVLGILKHRKKKRKYRSIYLSSTKVLRRSRMMRGKRVVSKVGQATHRDLQRVLSFGTGNTIGEDNVRDKSLHRVQKMSEDTSSVQHEAK